jgi:hypothetical protein
MTTNRQFANHEGEFKPIETCVTPCRKCGKENVRCESWESSDGAYEDYRYTCADCGHVWWIDGIDS